MTIRLDPEDHEIGALRSLVASFEGQRVLEVGCGDGRLTRRYAHEAAYVLAIDPDEGAIATARSDLPSRSIDVQRLAFDEVVQPDEGFDVVLFSWSL
jgi:2-polyprenyl-3-methyl-5-hydroxy-6-metoxy-1,4-benzoquinol methylase